MNVEYDIKNVSVKQEIDYYKKLLLISNEKEIDREIKKLKENKIKTHNISTEKTIDILDKCAKLWLNKEYSNRHIKMLSKITNQSYELVSYELQGSMKMLLRENIEKTISEEIGDLKIMDEWVETSFGKVHRQPRGLLFHNVSGNAFVVIPTSISMGLLSKNCNLVKVSADEPYFAYMFYKSLCEIDESIKDRLSVVYFDSSNKNIYETVAKQSDCIVHWGGEHSGKIMAELCAKYDTHLILHGAKISFEVIEKIDDENIVAKNVARDIVLWEQKACLSPRIIFVNKNLDVNQFAVKLSKALNLLSQVFPKAYLNAWSSIKTIQDRQYCLLKYGINKGEKVKLYSSFNADYTVLLEESLPDKADINRCFNRFVLICPYESKDTVCEYIEENLKDYLQTMGYSGNDEKFIEKMTQIGVSIVTKPGEMSVRYPGTTHDGMHNLKEMTYMVSTQIG
ncbi:acyl-CoA reductase [Clostridium felsineum]|uniref:acyl-CoA reductase n=1 Tax=Clostridium felsineum TaxID=36839 RepID=UPI00098CA6FF|nr:acyl-CoA reductase [Clostridium felsineum]URZ02812.1 Long-chain acyl-protein thioester reductase [Clostridium felsineum]